MIQKHTNHTGEDYIIHELGRMEENMETGAGVVPCVGTGHRILLLSFALLFQILREIVSFFIFLVLKTKTIDFWFLM